VTLFCVLGSIKIRDRRLFGRYRKSLTAIGSTSPGAIW
jgi:hypothetical protein